VDLAAHGRDIPNQPRGLYAVVRRALDIVLAGGALLVFSPLLLLLAIAIRLDSPGPALFRQRRSGRRSSEFTILKFRTMKVGTPDLASHLMGPGSSRVTRLGGFLRRTSLDELPQLWNVLKGDMSFVGPRPERPEFVEELTKEIRFYGQRHIVRPGITGWAQVRYTYGATTEDALQKLQFDLYYIKNLSIALDLFIIFETVKTVVLRKGA
jgi:lipopolysaccharide/colanic/teichoic acid biosynthesis glycosyltransferase